MSWQRQSLEWGNPDKVTSLQEKIRALKKKIKLVDVVDVMLHRRILPLQLRASPMWLHKPSDAPTLQNFFRADLNGMWTALFKPSQNIFPEDGPDCGYDAENGPSEVNPCTNVY